MSVNDKSPLQQFTKQITTSCPNCKKFKYKLKSIKEDVTKFRTLYLSAYRRTFQQIIQVNLQMNLKNSKQIMEEFIALQNQNKMMKSLLEKVQQMKIANKQKDNHKSYSNNKQNIHADNIKTKQQQSIATLTTGNQKSLYQLVEIQRAEIQGQKLKYSELQVLYKSSLEHNRRCQEEFLILVKQTQQIKQTLTKIKTYQDQKQSFSGFRQVQQSSQELSLSRQLQLSQEQISYNHQLETIKEVSEIDHQNEFNQIQQQSRQYFQNQQEYQQNDYEYSYEVQQQEQKNFNLDGNETFSQNGSKDNGKAYDKLQSGNRIKIERRIKREKINEYQLCLQQRQRKKSRKLQPSEDQTNYYSHNKQFLSQQQEQCLDMTRKFSVNNTEFYQGDCLEEQKQFKQNQTNSKFNTCFHNMDKLSSFTYANPQRLVAANKSVIHNQMNQKNYGNSDKTYNCERRPQASSNSQGSSLTITQAASTMNINPNNSCFLYDDNEIQKKFDSALQSPKTYLQALNILKSFKSCSQVQRQNKSTKKQFPLNSSYSHQMSILTKHKERNKENDLSKTLTQCSNSNNFQEFDKKQNGQTIFVLEAERKRLGQNTLQQKKIITEQATAFKAESYKSNQKQINSELLLSSKEPKSSNQKQGRKSIGKCWKTKAIKDQIMALYHNKFQDMVQMKELNELKPNSLFSLSQSKGIMNESFSNNNCQMIPFAKQSFQKIPARISPYYRTANKEANKNDLQKKFQSFPILRVEGPLLSPEIKQEIRNFSNIVECQKIFGGDMFWIKYHNGFKYQGKAKNHKNIMIPYGHGTLFNRQTNIIYSGEWKDGLFNGQGKLLIKINKALINAKENSIIATQYNGRFMNCQIQGEGTLIFQNGNKLICKMSKSMIQGDGVYFNNTSSSRTIISGRWRGNEMVEETHNY